MNTKTFFFHLLIVCASAPILAQNSASKNVSIKASSAFYAGSVSNDTLDYTSYIINPGIEASSGKVIPNGWTVEKGVSTTISSTGQHYSGVTINRYFDAWNPEIGAAIYTATQVVKGIPNGAYNLTAAARSSGSGSYIFANDKQTEIFYNGTSGGILGNGWSPITVENVAVLDNTITIGAKTTVGWTGTYFSVDDFSLKFLGEGDSTTYKPVLDKLIEKAKMFDKATTPNGADSILDAAIATAESATTLSTILSSYTTLKTAIDNCLASVAPFAELKALITTSTSYSTTTSYNGLETFIRAIVKADSIYNASKTVLTDIKIAITTLKAALNQYRSNQPATADFSFILVNPGFEEGVVPGVDSTSILWKNGNYFTPVGWNAYCKVDTTASGCNMYINSLNVSEGNYCYEMWGSPSKIESFNLSQKIIAPRSGVYIFSGDFRCDASSPSNTDAIKYDAHVYAKVNSLNPAVSSKLGEQENLITGSGWNTVAAWRTLTVAFYANVGDEITLGAASSSFMQLDNFKLIFQSENHFNSYSEGSGNGQMYFYIMSATIGGINLQVGDEIAVFDDTICCGKVALAQPIIADRKSTYAILAANFADEGLSNGFKVGNKITIKVWDSSISKEYSLINGKYFNILTGNKTITPTYTTNDTAFVKLSENQIPIANAGFDQTVNEGDIVTLDGFASFDEDGDNLAYSWFAPEGITLNSISIAKTTFIAPEVYQDTLYKFELMVNDGISNSVVNEVAIAVKLVPLIAHAGSDKYLTCGGSIQLDSVTTNYTGDGTLRYLWSPSIGLNNDTIPNPTINTMNDIIYTVEVKRPNNNSATDRIAVHINPLEKPVIGIVSVNENNKNMIIWNKSVSTSIESYNIYRESDVTDVYDKIGTVPYTLYNSFLDSLSSAMVQSNKYKVSILDKCGLETENSYPHKTMHLSINKGMDNTWNLIWEPYEGFTVSTYRVYRGADPYNLTLIGTTSGGSTQFSDYAAPSGYIYYQLEVISPNTVEVKSSVRKMSNLDKSFRLLNETEALYNKSRSNIATNSPVGLTTGKNSNKLFSFYPNPTKNEVFVNVNCGSHSNTVLKMYDIMGKLVNITTMHQNNQIVNTIDLNEGVYFLEISFDETVQREKLFIKR